MAKNITIREGDTSKQFTAKKLKVNQVGGGTVNFVPEDEVLDYVDLKDHTFNQSGTFNPSQFNCDGFRQVKIDIPADVKEKTITANGEYNAGDDNVLGYSKVTVNVPGGASGGPFTVIFYDASGNILQKLTNVPYGGTANFDISEGLPTPPLQGQVFVGWNPSPINVVDNMNCYPKFADQQQIAGEIKDSWEVICEKGGNEEYPLGSYKSLYYSADFTREELQAVGLSPNVGSQYNYFRFTFTTIMYKVAVGEDGSISTWISRPCQVNGYYSQDGVSWSASNTMFGTHLTFYWPNRWERKLLNLLVTKMATCFQNHIKEVTKYTQCSDKASEPFNTQPTAEKFWLVSVKEIYIKDWDSHYTPSYYSRILEQKYVGAVSSGVSYMTDILALNPQQRQDAFDLTSSGVGLRDTGFVWDQTYMTASDNYTGEWTDGNTYTARVLLYGRRDNGLFPSMLGFCLV